MNSGLTQLFWERCRTFAIISHPDAGKTTLTEAILYEAQLIHEMGQVKAKKGHKTASSDWMELEKQRGISITSSAVTFEYEGYRLNLIDTPGHQDFSEDTYRVLMAVDNACMLMDAAKGVEDRTRKLYEVCRYRQIPVLTFMNKIDREGKNPLDLLDEVEKLLNVSVYPLTWPIGWGNQFFGLADRYHNCVWRLKGQTGESPLWERWDWQDPRWPEGIPQAILQEFLDQWHFVTEFYPELDVKGLASGQVSPVTWGSAKWGWGVKLYLRFLLELGVGPQPRRLVDGTLWSPASPDFSAFVFKINANMDPKHRDRVAFLRIVSGQFERSMSVWHTRLNRSLRLNYTHTFVAQERLTADQAGPGDIIGVVDTGLLFVGDTLSTHPKIQFEPLPRFAPEVFARVSIKDPLKKLKLQQALNHLSHEGVVQLFWEWKGSPDPIVAAVGPLQLDVLMFRLAHEYQLSDATLQMLPYRVALWPKRQNQTTFDVKEATLFKDSFDQAVVLLNDPWDLKWLEKQNPDVSFEAPIQMVR